MPLGQLDANFITQSYYLREYAYYISLANAGIEQRFWMVPGLGAEGDLSPEGLAFAYDRDPISEAYAEALTSPEGTVGDGMSLKMQSDYLAAQERAYRLRSQGPVRCCMHASGRRYGHAQDNGTFGRIEAYAQDLIIAGAAGYVPPENIDNPFR